MTSADLLIDGFGRIQEVVRRVVEGVDADQLSVRVADRGNSIAWLVWHLTRIADDHIADVAGVEQVWATDGWIERFGLPFRPGETGYGHGAEEVAAVRVPDGALLTGYHDAVHHLAVDYVSTIADADLDRVVDTRWDPPVTLGVRLVSVISDGLQHAGQAAFVRGLLT